MDHLNQTPKRNTLDNFACAREAACSLRVTSDHIGRLCRAGVLECRKFGGAWYVSLVSIQRRARGPDRRPADRPSHRDCPTVHARDVPPSGRSGQGGYIAAGLLVITAVLAVANAAAFLGADRIAGRLVTSSRVHYQADSTAKQPAAAAAAFSVPADAHPKSISFSSLALAHQQDNEPGDEPRQVAAATEQPVVFEREIEPGRTVSLNTLAAALNILRSELLERINDRPALLFSGPAATTPATVQMVAHTNKIDQLTNTTINSPTITGGTITDAASITVAGNLTVSGAQTLSGALTVPYITATSTDSDSTFVGLIASRATTTNATSTNLFASSLATNNATSTNQHVSGTLSLMNALSVAYGGTGAASFDQGFLYSPGGAQALTASSSPTVGIITATSTTATSTLPRLEITTALRLGADHITDLTGIGLTLSGSALTVNLGDFDTGDLAEGSNLYWTNARFDERLSATTTLPNLTTLANLATVGTITSGTWQARVIQDAFVANDITLDNITQITNRSILDTTGTLTVARGGTGITSIGQGQILYGSAADTIAATSSIFLAQSANVGIGTTTPGSLLEVHKNQNATTELRVTNPNTGGGAIAGIRLRAAGATNGIMIQTSNALDAIFNNLENSHMAFKTSNTERMRIHSGGAVSIGSTGTGNLGAKLYVAGQVEIDNAIRYNNLGSGTGDQDLCRFTSSNQIGQCASSIQFKKDVQDLTLDLDTILALRPVMFTWKEIGTPDLGFIAEEIATVDPLLATYDDEGNIRGVQYKELTAVLTNAAKELWTRLQDLAQRVRGNSDRIAQLEARMSELEAQLGASAASIGIAPFHDADTAPDPPTVTVLGNSLARVEIGDTNSDLGATAKDRHGRDLTVHVYLSGEPVEHLDIDTRQPGEYEITYRAEDGDGRTAEASRTVIVYDPDEAADGPDSETATSSAASIASPQANSDQASSPENQPEPQQEPDQEPEEGEDKTATSPTAANDGDTGQLAPASSAP